MPNRAITFRPVVRGDLPRLRAWISQPHWQEWWGDVEEEIGYIVEMIEGRDTTRPFIFVVDGEDAGYIQYWYPKDQLFEPWLSEAPWLADLPSEAVGVDISIASPNSLGQGMGTKVLSAFVDKLRNLGESTIIIDPDPKNIRAVRAYEKAGFRVMADFLNKTGDYLLMKHEEALS